MPSANILPAPYPPAHRGATVDDFHGSPIADPYRWLEDPTAPETRAWVAAQAEITERFLAAIPARDGIKERLTALWNYPRVSCPARRGTQMFFFRNDGLQAQDLLLVQTGAEGSPRVLLDPNQLSADGTIALTSLGTSKDGARIAYGLSEQGSDWQTIRVRDVATAADAPDQLRWCRFAQLAWSADGAGFFYNRYPEPASTPAAEHGRHSRICYHRLGTPQDEDRLVFAHEDPDLLHHPQVTDDQRYLLVSLHRGTMVENRLYYQEIDAAGIPVDPGVSADTDFLNAQGVPAADGVSDRGAAGLASDAMVRLLDAEDASYQFAGNRGSLFYFLTDLDAPRGRIIAIDVMRPGRGEWREVVGEQAWVIASAEIVGGRLVVVGLVDAAHRLWLYDLEGALETELPLPGIGTIAGRSGRPDDREMFLGYTSFDTPGMVLRYDFDSGALDTWWQPPLPIEPADYVTRQVFVTSRDGARVPMFILHRRDLRPDGRRPTMLGGYGGFNLSQLPAYAPSVLAWADLGGVYCLANLRGGGEYGMAWHESGMLERKQNVFDDFIAAGEWLVASGYTTPERLAIRGGSNGGLLVAACMLQRPDLFGAVLCSRPVIDMLRYQHFTIGRFWVGEYGDADADPEHFRFLADYSPLHNVRPGVNYPPILILTADTDDRVVPAHAYKFAAELQAVAPGPRLTLIRVESAAGHGLGMPVAKVIDEQGDALAFLVQVIGIEK